MKPWQDIVIGFLVGLVLIWMAIEIVTLKGRVADLEQARANTAFYLVESTTGRQLKLEKIE